MLLCSFSLGSLTNSLAHLLCASPVCQALRQNRKQDGGSPSLLKQIYFWFRGHITLRPPSPGCGQGHP